MKAEDSLIRLRAVPDQDRSIVAIKAYALGAHFGLARIERFGGWETPHHISLNSDVTEIASYGSWLNAPDTTSTAAWLTGYYLVNSILRIAAIRDRLCALVLEGSKVTVPSSTKAKLKLMSNNPVLNDIRVCLEHESLISVQREANLLKHNSIGAASVRIQPSVVLVALDKAILALQLAADLVQRGVNPSG